jgi:hypothetical protein
MASELVGDDAEHEDEGMNESTNEPLPPPLPPPPPPPTTTTTTTWRRTRSGSFACREVKGGGGGRASARTRRARGPGGKVGLSSVGVKLSFGSARTTMRPRLCAEALLLEALGAAPRTPGRRPDDTNQGPRSAILSSAPGRARVRSGVA